MPDKEKTPILFKSENSLWQLMAEGKKTWDARLHDISDDRIYRLSLGMWDTDEGRQPYYKPTEDIVSFLNKVTGEVLMFRFRELEFVVWAPGWVFIQLGGLVARRLPDGSVTVIEGETNEPG